MAGTTQSANRERYQVLKTMLEERRQEIQDKLRSIREDLPNYHAEVRDAEEQSVTDFVHEMDFALMEMKAATLRRIDEALQRLEDGSYGTCAECDAEIAEARLKAVSFAVLCRDCQEQEETRAAEERVTTHVRALPPVGV